MSSGIRSYSPEQQEVIETFGKGMAVSAGAGAGKTSTLVAKCVRLLELNPEARFAAVSFTEKSAAELRERLATALPAGLSGQWVMTIHGLCGSILREYPRLAGFEGEEQMLSPAEQAALWERAQESLWHRDLPGAEGAAIDRLLQRENRAALMRLIERARNLRANGVLEKLEQSGNPDEAALAVVTRFVVARYEKLKRRRGGLDFSDLEEGADRALEDSRVREDFQRRFDLVMVDEFQDTNPLQARIIERFVRPDRSNLVVVGDPKQSIYRFRDADVTVFDEFCASLPVRLNLSRNYRSRPGVIEFANQVCAPLFEASRLEFTPLEAQRPEHEAGELPVVALDLSGDAPTALARYLASEHERGVAWDEYAILLRRIRGSERWLHALSAAGIPVAVGSGGLFWSDPRVRELVSFLRWWVQPENRLSASVFLRAPWAGFSDEWLSEALLATTEKEGPELWDLFWKSESPWVSALRPLRGKTVRVGELLEALTRSENWPETESEIGAAWLGLWHRAEELSRSGLGIFESVRELSQAMTEERREREVPPPANRGQIRVLTLHGSKGLEFPRVVLVDFPEKAKVVRDYPLLYWDRARGAMLAPRDENLERDKDAESEWRAHEKAAIVGESKRLFYVALTRAQEQLVLAFERGDDAEGEEPPVEKKSSKPKSSPLEEDFWRAWVEKSTVWNELPRAAVEGVEALARLESGASEAYSLQKTEGTAIPYRPRHSVTEWLVLGECARKYEWRYLRPRQLDDESAADSSEPGGSTAVAPSGEPSALNSMDARTMGTRVHAAIEARDETALTQLENEVGAATFRAAPVLDWWHSSELMQVQDHEREWSELAFEVPIGEGETLVGAIDRLVQREDGSWDLIDFKISSRPKSAAALLASYQEQLALYAWALSRMSGEPQEIRAWLVGISPQGVTEVEVPFEVLERGEATAQARWQEARRLVPGLAGEARPEPRRCGHCEFREGCDARK